MFIRLSYHRTPSEHFLHLKGAGDRVRYSCPYGKNLNERWFIFIVEGISISRTKPFQFLLFVKRVIVITITVIKVLTIGFSGGNLSSHCDKIEF